MSITERWGHVEGSDGVEVSTLGRVRRHGELVTLNPGKRRRAAVGLGRRRRRLVQYLVLEVFVGPRPEGLICCHRNDDPTDNRLENLYWGTYSDNARDKVRNGLDPEANKTHCDKGHEFTPENIYPQTSGGRGCRECRRANAAAYRERAHMRTPEPCSFDGCLNAERSKGLCSGHWKQQHAGKPLAPLQPWPEQFRQFHQGAAA